MIKPDYSASNVIYGVELRLLSEKAALMSALALDPFLKDAVIATPAELRRCIRALERTIRDFEPLMANLHQANEAVSDLYKAMARAQRNEDGKEEEATHGHDPKD